MAVKKSSTINHYTCLSSDTKPSSIPVNSILYETNTGKSYIYNGTDWIVRDATIDVTTNSTKMIDVVHQEIHGNNHYTGTYTETVGTGTAVTIMITAPGTTESHFVFDLMASNSITATWSESPNASAGSAVTPYDNRRISATTAETTMKSGVTYTSAGTILENFAIGGSNAGTRIGGVAGARNEWILNNSTNYLIRVVAGNAGTVVAVNMRFYEVE